MGYIIHHAIIVTASDHQVLGMAHLKALELGMRPTVMTEADSLNGYRSFFIPPDGSKEGWNESERGDIARAELVKFLETLAYEDGSSPVGWVEVQYGGDEPSLNTKILRHSGDKAKSGTDGEEMLDSAPDGTER